MAAFVQRKRLQLLVGAAALALVVGSSLPARLIRKAKVTMPEREAALAHDFATAPDGDIVAIQLRAGSLSTDVTFADIDTSDLSGGCKLLLDGEDPKALKKQGTEVGMTAREIAGKDSEGKKFKLSNHRGKVVLLTFWGHWCPPCRAMYPHERSLVSKLADKPFVLLGVNSDKDRDALTKVRGDEKLTWRSFWDDGGTNGPIARDWQIRGWPTLFLIDHKGVIRHRFVGAPQPAVLDKAIDDLLKEVSGR